MNFTALPICLAESPNSPGWGTMTAQESCQVTGKCALASLIARLGNVPLWNPCIHGFGQWCYPLFWYGLRQLYLLSKLMDNKVETESCTKIVFESFSLFTLPGKLPLPSCRRLVLRTNVFRLVGLSFQCMFYIFLLGQEWAFAKIGLVSNLFWHNTWFLP